MSAFKERDDDVYRRAMSLLPDDYCHTAGRYCQEDGCPSNTRRPGHAARCVDGSNWCIWHDDDAMSEALEAEDGRKSVRRALTLLKRSGAMSDGEYIWKHALEILPLDFALSAQLCANSWCQFSLKHIGRPARTHASSDLCAWCDGAI